MKRFLKIAIIFALAAACVLALASCGGHEHTFSEDWTSDENNHWHAATCEHTDEVSAVGAHTFGADGKCTVCDKEKTAEHTHTFSSEWSHNGFSHWHAATCFHTLAVEGLENHQWGADGKCSVCGFEPAAHTDHTFNYDEYVSDETGHWYAAICCGTAKDGFGAHTIGEGNICTVCGYDSEHKHTYSSAWSSDDINHWHAADCGHNSIDPDSLDAHSYDKNFKCTVCEYQHSHRYNYAGGFKNDGEGHWYEASCGHDSKGSYEEHNYTANYICASCGYAHEHTYSGTLTYNTTDHWYASTCGHDAKSGFEQHKLNGNGECKCGYSEEVKSIYDIIDGVAPTKIVSIIEYVVHKDTVVNNEVVKEDEILNGEFITLISGNNMIFTYSYEMFSSLEDSLNGADRIKTVSGTVYYRDGLYSEDGFEWSAQAPSDAELVFEITSEYLLNAKISDDGNSLTAEIAPENAKNVFGSDLSASENIKLSVETNGINLFRIVASAKTESGADITVKTSYTYNKVELEYPDGKGGADDTGDGADELADFSEAISNTEPAEANISTSLLTVHSSEPMRGLYDIVYHADGTVTVKYAYMKLNAIGEGDSMFSTVAGTAEIDAEGNVTGDVNGTVIGAAAINANLDAEKIEYSISKGVLTAKIKAADVKTVLGVETGADTTMTMTVVSGKVVSLTVSYTSAQGPVEIVCSYK